MSDESSTLIQLGFVGAPFGVRGWVKLRLNVARIEHWVSKGAHMSDRVKFLLTSFRKQAA